MDDNTFIRQLAALIPEDNRARYEFLQWNFFEWTKHVHPRASPREAIQSHIASENESANRPDITELDGRIQALCGLYEQLTKEQREILRAEIRENLAESLLHFAWRMAVRALREKSDTPLRLGLIALVIEDRQTDWRITWIRLGYICYAATRLCVDFDSIARAVSEFATEATRELLARFIEAEPEYKKPNPATFKEATSIHGPTLVRLSRRVNRAHDKP